MNKIKSVFFLISFIIFTTTNTIFCSSEPSISVNSYTQQPTNTSYVQRIFDIEKIADELADPKNHYTEWRLEKTLDLTETFRQLGPIPSHHDLRPETQQLLITTYNKITESIILTQYEELTKAQLHGYKRVIADKELFKTEQELNKAESKLATALKTIKLLEQRISELSTVSSDVSVSHRKKRKSQNTRESTQKKFKLDDSSTSTLDDFPLDLEILTDEI